MKDVHTENAKKVATFGADGAENGSLTELFKEGDKTIFYLTTIKPGSFKGYHLHRVRAARYVCIRGKIKITVYKNRKKFEYILDASKPSRLFIPSNTPTGLLNIGDEDAWLINYPDPPYDPKLKDEQVEYTEDELKEGMVK